MGGTSYFTILDYYLTISAWFVFLMVVFNWISARLDSVRACAIARRALLPLTLLELCTALWPHVGIVARRLRGQQRQHDRRRPHIWVAHRLGESGVRASVSLRQHVGSAAGVQRIVRRHCGHRRCARGKFPFPRTDACKLGYVCWRCVAEPRRGVKAGKVTKTRDPHP